ncbi:MAG: carbohydrate ABC transporter permease [Euzebya sp.]
MTAQPETVPDTTKDRRAGLSKKSASEKAEEGTRSWFSRIGMAVLVALWVIPTLGLLVSSFRTSGAVNQSGWWTVLGSLDNLTLQNYSEVFSQSAGGDTLADAFVNTFVVAVPSTIIPILIAAFAAYAFSWMDFPGRETLFIIFVAALVIPLQVAFIPILSLYGAIGIQGTFVSVWLAHAGFGMPLAVYLLRNYIGALPREIMESANIDGASHFQVFWRLIIPLSVPALASFAIFQFLWTWNDFLVALIMLNQGQVATTYLAQLIGSFGEAAHLLTAGAFITMTVPLLVFFGLQRYFVRGLTAGSVKG